MKLLLLVFALFAAFQAGRAYGDEADCSAFFTGGATQEELAAWHAAGDDAIGYDDETGCWYVD